RRVKPGAVINNAVGARMKTAGGGVEITGEILHLAIRRNEEHPLVAELEKVGALPGGNFWIGKFKERAAISPFCQFGISRLVNVHDGMALLFQMAAGDEKGFLSGM